MSSSSAAAHTSAALDTSDPDSASPSAQPAKRARRARSPQQVASPVARATRQANTLAQRVERMIAQGAHPRAVMDALETEKDFQKRVVTHARLHGWLVWHDVDSTRNAPGLPDLILCRWGATDAPARLIFAELKTERGRLTADQRHWLFTLGHVPGVEVVVWRPSAWRDIERALL